MKPFQAIGRVVRRVESDTLLGVAVGLAVVILLGNLFLGTYLAIGTHSATQNTNTILTNGQTSSAKSAKQGAIAAREGERIIAHVENQLDQILARSDTNRALICSIADSAHVTSSIIQGDCGGQ